MRSLVRFTLRQQVLFNLLFLLMIVAGVMALDVLPVERYPEINFGKVEITTIYPGASPADVEALVTREIEEALDGLENLEFIRSSSLRERSLLTVKFRDDTDYEALYDELRFRVLSVLDRLPAGVDPPRFDLIKTSYWLPVVSVNLLGERANRALSLMAEELQVPLSQIPGVTEVRLGGDQEREFHVFLDPGRLKLHGVSFDEVAAALQETNLTLPAGDFNDASGEFVVRVDERFRDREQLVRTIVRRDADGSFVRVADLISEARLGYRDPAVLNSVNGRDAVSLQLIKAKHGNALEIYAAAEAVIADFAAALEQEGVEVVLTQDSTTYVEESIATLGWNLVVGVLLVGLILWYFMGFRNAGLVSVGIPFSFMVTMVVMQLTGSSLNEITLFSFVLVSGIIVDDAIVVVENIYRHIQQGEPLEQAIVEGTDEVAWPVISATATTVAAFLPMLMMTGSTGEFFALIPKAVSFALIASLLECLLILPLHYRDFGPRPVSASKPLSEHDNLVLRTARVITDRVVRLLLRARLLSLATVLLLFVAALAVLGVSIAGIAPLVRIQFFPDDYNLYYAFVEGPPTTTIETIDARVKAMADFVMADGPGYARSAAGFAGFRVTEDYENEFGYNIGTLMVALPRKEDRAFVDALVHLERMRERLEQQFERDGFQIQVRAEKDGPPSGKDVNIQVVGSSDAAVEALSAEILARLAAHPVFGPGLIDLADDRGQPSRVLRLAVESERAQELGLTPGAVARLAASVLDGRYLGKYRLSDEEVDLKLRITPEALVTPESALDIPLLEHPSGPVTLRDLVTLRHEIQPRELKRYQRQRSISIRANIAEGADFASANLVAWVRETYQTLRADYPGATLVFGGEFEETQRSFDSLTRAFGLSVLLIYLILAAEFRSYAQPIIVLSAVVFAIIGVVFGKLVTQSLFTVNSFIAVVGVTGVVVNDSLMLLDFMNRAYRGGCDRATAILQGVQLRLRPILLTTLTTVLALLPMAVGFPDYSIIWGTMASTFVTGLATATILTLFIVPLAWDLLTEWQERHRKASGKPADPDLG